MFVYYRQCLCFGPKYCLEVCISSCVSDINEDSRLIWVVFWQCLFELCTEWGADPQTITLARLLWGTYSLVWSPRVRRCLFVSSPWSRRAQGLVVSTQKTASIWWCCCGCSLKFVCREWSKEKAFRQIALWISALHLLLFLACGTHVVCHEWNAAERRVKGEKIWKRQEDPDMNLTHPQNAYINWSFAVWGKS